MANISFEADGYAAAQLQRYVAMSEFANWTTEDFDNMSWHDVHVHGFRLEENSSSEGSAELFLDIDYILGWHTVENHFEFVIAQATLQFHHIFGLKFLLDYVTPSAGMCPFSLAGIERELVTYETGYTSYKWRLEINWPQGFMEFLSPGFSQRLTGKRHAQSGQALNASQRNTASAT